MKKHDETKILIEKILQETFNPSKLLVLNESHLHVGHEGANENPKAGHFKVVIQTEIFLGLNKVKQHRMIYDALSSLMKVKIHALTIESDR